MRNFIPELNPNDQAILRKHQLERFAYVLADAEWYKIDIQEDCLILEALETCWADLAIRGFNILMEAATIILGCNSISLFYADEWIADYTREMIVGHGEIDSMIATLDREMTTDSLVVDQQQQASTQSPQNTDYVSLDQLRAMAVEIGGENEEFLGWMESQGIPIPTRFFNGVPRYQSKAIIKAAQDWNNQKMHRALSRFFGTTPEQLPAVPAHKEDGTVSTPGTSKSAPLKMLRTPSGFKPITTGRDKFAKTMKVLAEGVGTRWPEYLQLIVNQDEIGVSFLNRIAKPFNSTDAYAKLLEVAQNIANGVEHPEEAAA